MEFWNVGDIVRVVDKPYRECPASWVPEMDDACGHEVEITYADMRIKNNGETWQICCCKPTDPETDMGAFHWNFCSECFVSVVPDFEAAPEADMKDLFGLG